MVNCKMSNVSTNKVNPDDVVKVTIAPESVPIAKEDPVARDSVDVDNSLTPYEKMAQKMLDALRSNYNTDPTGQFLTVAVMVSGDHGKTWNIRADSTEAQSYEGQEIWSAAYVEAEVAKTKTAYSKSPV